MTDPTPTHTERVTDSHGDFIQVWYLTPPDVGTLFRVIDETWDESTKPPTRHIHRFEELHL